MTISNVVIKQSNFLFRTWLCLHIIQSSVIFYKGNVQSGIEFGKIRQRNTGLEGVRKFHRDPVR